MKIVIAYCSTHHGNTKKLVAAIASGQSIDTIDVTENSAADLNDYDVIGFASGIYFSKYHKSLLAFVEKNLPERKKVFFLHTAGDPRENQNAAIKEITDRKKCACLGTYFCKGFDTYGPFKLIGGIAKGHPDSTDMQGAVTFFKTALSGASTNNW